MPASRELAELGVTAHIVHPPKPGVGWANDAVTMTYASDYHHIATMEDVAKIIGPLSEEMACFVAGNVTHLRLGEDSTLWSSGPMRYRNPSGTGLQKPGASIDSFAAGLDIAHNASRSNVICII